MVVTVERLVVTVERLVVTVERLAGGDSRLALRKAALAPAMVLDSAILSGLLKPREAGGGALREGAEVRAEGEGKEG